MSEHLRPIETGRMKDVLSTGAGVFVDTMVKKATLSMKTGVFVDTKGKMTASARNRGVFMATKGDKRKRDTPERMSLYLALSREGRLKNRGRPWPREREGPNAVGRDLVFQPSLPVITC